MTTTDTEQIPLDSITASRTNPRKNFEPVALQGLADDIKEKGVLQPIVIRRLPDGLPLGDTPLYEIVIGERRYRASRLAGLTTIPARIKVYTDQEALEAQMVENIQRRDLDPIEESEGLQAMLDYRDANGQPVYTVEMLAAKLHKDTSHVYRRLKLRNLPPLARQALLDDILPIATATLIARIPNEESRKTAAQEIVKPRYQDAPLSRDKAQEFINQNFMRELKGAPFDQTDSKLIPKMGPCTTCPFKTGNSPELYGDVKRGDICTNPPCFNRKSETTWTRTQAAAEKEGKKVLSDEEGEKVFQYRGSSELAWNSPYVDLRKPPAPEMLVPGLKNPPNWKKLLAKGPCEVEIVLVRDAAGKVHELVDRKLAVEAVKQAIEAGTAPDVIAAERKNGSTENDKWKEQRKAEKDKAKLAQKVARAVVGKIVSSIEQFGVSESLMDTLLQTAIHQAGYVGCQWVERRRGLPSDAKVDPQDAITAYATTLTDPQREALLVELLIADGVRNFASESEILQPWLTLCGVEPEKVVAELETAESEKGKKKGKGKK